MTREVTTKTKEAPIAVEVVNGHLVPADPWAQDELAKLPQRTRFNAYLTLAKASDDDEHGALLRKYMAGINQLYDWFPITGPGTEFPTPTQLRREILKQIHFCTVWPQRDGSERREALSMAREAMSFEDLEICFELSRMYVGAWTENVTGERFDPWEAWEREHPPVGR